MPERICRNIQDGLRGRWIFLACLLPDFSTPMIIPLLMKSLLAGSPASICCWGCTLNPDDFPDPARRRRLPRGTQSRLSKNLNNHHGTVCHLHAPPFFEHRLSSRKMGVYGHFETDEIAVRKSLIKKREPSMTNRGFSHIFGAHLDSVNCAPKRNRL